MADFTKALIEEFFDREFGGFVRSDTNVNGARDGEIGWRIQSKIDGGFDERFDGWRMSFFSFLWAL